MGATDPHLDPEQWPGLIEAIGPSSILVVIARAMGTRLANHTEPEDLWQDTLEQAWRDRASHRWQNPRVFRAWLLAIANHRVLDCVDRVNASKRGAGHAPLSLPVRDASSSRDRDGIVAKTATPGQRAMHKERAASMERALAALDPDEAEVVHLHLFEDLTMRDVAARVQAPEATCWSRFRRGLTSYREQLRRLEATRS